MYHLVRGNENYGNLRTSVLHLPNMLPAWRTRRRTDVGQVCVLVVVVITGDRGISPRGRERERWESEDIRLPQLGLNILSKIKTKPSLICAKNHGYFLFKG